MTASRGGRGTRRSGRQGHDEDEYAATGGAPVRDEDAYERHDAYDEDTYDEDSGHEGEDERAPGRPRGRPGGLSATRAARAALGHITDMTGKPAEGITSVRPDENGWTVGVELLDARHIPRSSDTLALYAVEIDADGELRSYQRVARYSRAHASSEVP